MKNHHYFIVSFLFLFVHLSTIQLQAQSIESFVKASLIVKIAQYTEWSNPQTTDEFRISILGESPFKGELEKLVSKTNIKNKFLKISYCTNIKDANHSELVFISKSKANQIDDIVRFYDSKDVLLISDSEGFSKKGVHFNFFKEKDETIHFEINLKALAKSGLRPDLKLLSVGKIIN